MGVRVDWCYGSARGPVPLVRNLTRRDIGTSDTTCTVAKQGHLYQVPVSRSRSGDACSDAETHVSAVLLCRLRGSKRADHAVLRCFEAGTAELHCCAPPMIPTLIAVSIGRMFVPSSGLHMCA